MQNLLFQELELAIRTTKSLLMKIQPGQWDYRPHENMRSLLELCNHLAEVPSVDLAIMQEKTADEVKKIENGLTSSDPQKLCNVMDAGYQALHDYLATLSESDFMEKITTPFYGDHGFTQAKWLIEVVTHVFHHRSQLFTYLKQLNVSVNMFDLY